MLTEKIKKDFKDLLIKEGMKITHSRLSVLDDITAYSSDKRLKENIEIIDSPLEKINQLSMIFLINKGK